MTTLAAISLIAELTLGVKNAIAAGRADVSEDDLDKALDKLEDNDNEITRAIERRRQRDAAGE